MIFYVTGFVSLQHLENRITTLFGLGQQTKRPETLHVTEKTRNIVEEWGFVWLTLYGWGMLAFCSEATRRV